jgi:hypothetical protein
MVGSIFHSHVRNRYCRNFFSCIYPDFYLRLPTEDCFKNNSNTGYPAQITGLQIPQTDRTDLSDDCTELPDVRTEFPDDRTKLPDVHTDFPDDRTNFPNVHTEFPDDRLTAKRFDQYIQAFLS